MLEWVAGRQALLWWLGALSVVMFVGSLIVLPMLVVRIPADYFRHKDPPPDRWRDRHPVVRLTVLAVKNVVGVILVLAGIAMLFLPGQGLLTIAVGILLLNFPRKRELERWLVGRPGILRALNWLRAKAHHAPLLPPEEE